MSMNMFGIPFSGADICGYSKLSGFSDDVELCTRWHQVGSVQPFSRNYRDCANFRHDPIFFENITVDNTNTTYIEVMKNAILTKYSLMRYFYT